MNADNTVAWERFARMRLEGRSDLIYRAYDLLTPSRMHSDILMLFKVAGVQHAKDEAPYNTLVRLQRQFLSWGFGVQTTDRITELLREYQSYRRCKDKNRAARWPYRSPDETARLYAEHVAAENMLRGNLGATGETAASGLPAPVNVSSAAHPSTE